MQSNLFVVLFNVNYVDVRYYGYGPFRMSSSVDIRGKTVLADKLRFDVESARDEVFDFRSLSLSCFLEGLTLLFPQLHGIIDFLMRLQYKSLTIKYSNVYNIARRFYKVRAKRASNIRRG